jgi:hypothetical protein
MASSGHNFGLTSTFLESPIQEFHANFREDFSIAVTGREVSS